MKTGFSIPLDLFLFCAYNKDVITGFNLIGRAVLAVYNTNKIDINVQRELELIKESVLKTVPAEAIYLFGSYAKGNANEDSDLDIYVVIPDNIGKDPLDVNVDIRMDLCKRRSMPMDLIVGKSSMFNRRKQHLTMENTVLNEGILIYSLQC